MKASNPLVMVQSYRLLAAEQYRLGWDYPLHLGVTEAGEGEDGRMKSAIGIGTLLADGLGDTIRVSLTEDPEREYAPCNRLAEIAESRLATNPQAKARQAAVKPYVDTRDITSFARRHGALPEQKEGDAIDVRGFLHRDGSVFSAVEPEMFSKENAPYLYKDLGCKSAVGMPFKDIATTDSILLRTVPPASDIAARTAIRRLVEVSMGVIVPVEELEKNPLPNAVALMDLDEAIARDGKVRFWVCMCLFHSFHVGCALTCLARAYLLASRRRNPACCQHEREGKRRDNVENEGSESGFCSPQPERRRLASSFLPSYL
jgi:(E)-4-hydroxy-3-methylbut-2-enyl-diphosphate synthase